MDTKAMALQLFTRSKQTTGCIGYSSLYTQAAFLKYGQRLYAVEIEVGIITMSKNQPPNVNCMIHLMLIVPCISLELREESVQSPELSRSNISRFQCLYKYMCFLAKGLIISENLITLKPHTESVHKYHLATNNL